MNKMFPRMSGMAQELTENDVRKLFTWTIITILSIMVKPESIIFERIFEPQVKTI